MSSVLIAHDYAVAAAPRLNAPYYYVYSTWCLVIYAMCKPASTASTYCIDLAFIAVRH